MRHGDPPRERVGLADCTITCTPATAPGWWALTRKGKSRIRTVYFHETELVLAGAALMKALAEAEAKAAARAPAPREAGTNPRQRGQSPRQLGANPRRDGPPPVPAEFLPPGLRR